MTKLPQHFLDLSELDTPTLAGIIGTDAVCAETVAWRTGELAGALVGPTLSVGMSEHHMHFPGSVTLRPTTLVAVVRDVILSLARHGFRRIFFVNGHGGNTASIHAGFFEAYADAPRLVDCASRRGLERGALRRPRRRPRLGVRGLGGIGRLPGSRQVRGDGRRTAAVDARLRTGGFPQALPGGPHGLPPRSRIGGGRATNHRNRGRRTRGDVHGVLGREVSQSSNFQSYDV